MWSWLAVGLSGLLHIQAEQNNNKRASVMFKIFSLFLLGLLTVTTVGVNSVSLWLILGLVAFICGDWLTYRCSAGKFSFSCFLIGSLLYSKLFWMQMNSEVIWWLPALLFASCIVAFLLLLPQLDTVVFPVTVAGIVMIYLSGVAGEVWLNEHTLPSVFGFLGTLILMISALLYVISSYKKNIAHAVYWTSGCYLLAHGLIVSSQIMVP